MTDVAQTSIDSYHALDPEMLSAWHKALLGCYRKYGPLSDREAGDLLGKAPSFISARRNELIDEDKGYLAVMSAGHKLDPLTNMTVRLWTIIPARCAWMYETGVC
jgi:hypothetical protein